MTKNHVKCLTLLVIREMKIKNTMWYYCYCKCWDNYNEKDKKIACVSMDVEQVELIYCWWESNFVQHFANYLLVWVFWEVDAKMGVYMQEIYCGVKGRSMSKLGGTPSHSTHLRPAEEGRTVKKTLQLQSRSKKVLARKMKSSWNKVVN